MTPRPPAVLRILIVEDDPVRERILRKWMREGFRAVVVSTAGTAIGTIRMDSGSVYAGIVLDHDLQQRATVASDTARSGRDVLDAIVRYIAKDVPVLVHSMNASQAAPMVQALRRAGFSATQIPMDQLDERRFDAWLETARRKRAGEDDQTEEDGPDEE